LLHGLTRIRIAAGLGAIWKVATRFRPARNSIPCRNSRRILGHSSSRPSWFEPLRNPAQRLCGAKKSKARGSHSPSVDVGVINEPTVV